MRRMVKFIPILIQNSCGMKNNAPSLCDILEQTIYPCNQCSEMARTSHPLLNLSPCACSRLKRCGDSLCPSFTHTIVATAILPPPFLFLHVIYVAQSRVLDFPTHTHTHLHTRQLWLANDLQSQMGSVMWMGLWPACKCMQSKLDMEESRHPFSFPHRNPLEAGSSRGACVEEPFAIWCRGISAWGWIMSGRGRAAGKPEQLGLSITSPTMWQPWTQFLRCSVTRSETCQQPRCSPWKKLLHNLESQLFDHSLERRGGGMMWSYE